MSQNEVRLPDIGDFKDVPIIEVVVKPGDQIGIDDTLIVLESDKATMDVPSPVAGTVAEVKVKPGVDLQVAALDGPEAGGVVIAGHGGDEGVDDGGEGGAAARVEGEAHDDVGAFAPDARQAHQPLARVRHHAAVLVEHACAMRFRLRALVL